jgi:hypothetical protein
MRKLSLPLLMAALLLAAGCKNEVKEETGVFEFQIVPLVGGQAFERNQVFENVLGQRYLAEEWKLYLSDLRLLRADGGEDTLADVMLFDFGGKEVKKTDHGAGLFKTFDVKAGEYKGLKFSIGVPARLNNGNPAVYEASHPLSPVQGMHWNWTTGYIFMRFDGRVDSSAAGNGPVNMGITYHTGDNSLLREKSYAEPAHAFLVEPDKELQFILELDLNRLFYSSSDTIDMVQQNLTHALPVGSEAYRLAEQVTNNLSNNALYKVPF